MMNLLSNVFGTRHDRERKRVQPIVDEINEHDARRKTVSEEELRGQTEKFRARIREVTGAVDARIADLKERKKVTADPAAREDLDFAATVLDVEKGRAAHPADATHDSPGHPNDPAGLALKRGQHVRRQVLTLQSAQGK